MSYIFEQPSLPQTPATNAIQCPGCHNTFSVTLANGGKDIHFLNFVTWYCPSCKKRIVTPFLETNR
jgi:hypothetical protein